MHCLKNLTWGMTEEDTQTDIRPPRESTSSVYTHAHTDSGEILGADSAQGGNTLLYLKSLYGCHGPCSPFQGRDMSLLVTSSLLPISIPFALPRASLPSQPVMAPWSCPRLAPRHPICCIQLGQNIIIHELHQGRREEMFSRNTSVMVHLLSEKRV